MTEDRLLRLVRPSRAHLDSYIAALLNGWSPENLRPEVAQEQLGLIAEDADLFLGSLVDLDASGGPIVLPDGSQAPRLPGYHSWLWDGEFCGSIGLRWQPGTAELPSYCLGHIGYSVVPWKRRRGYASLALALLLLEARSLGLPFVELTTSVTNTASQRVIAANGGALHERFNKPAQYGGEESFRYRIAL